MLSGILMDVNDFIALWGASGASERANKDSYLKDLCTVLGLPHPAPCTGDRARDTYVFEADAVLPHEGGTVSIGKIDLYKAGCFVLEAKQGSDAGANKLGTARRGTPGWNIAMRDAFGQALGYARTLEEAPPFLIVADIGYCFDLYASFDGTFDYRPFPDAQSSRLFLADLARHAPTLRAVWTEPHALDPAKQKVRVTREIAALIAELSATLEEAGHPPEFVAKFLMRALFTMFAEDVGLLEEGMFTRALTERWCKNPASFTREVEQLWSLMNTGGDLFMVGKILRFNGGLFADPRALPLTRPQLEILLAAAKCDWTDVEPAIFGTLLERALSKKERHALGAHYTPREYVARLVKPTIEEPLRGEWDTVRVQARQLVAGGGVPEAVRVVGAFHKRLCTLKVLDPACGTGNFLYVALDTFKRLESEVLALLVELGDTQAMFGARVKPDQFLGIEVKPWAREIADLVLWLGYLGWNARISGKAAVKEPVLEKYDNIECRDAVLEWDRIEPVRDAEGRPVTRWDGESMKVHPVTGREVPDESKTVPVERYVNPRPAVWPKADFIVGNPPFIGNKRMRDALGDGYAEALRGAYPDVPSTVDLVMYWWYRAADLLSNARIRRFGLITTNSITQVLNRSVVERCLGRDQGGLAITRAVPDHPWVLDGAAVRIAMTVVDRAGEPVSAILEQVVAVEERRGEAPGVTLRACAVGRIHADLRAGADVAGSPLLVANRWMCQQGVKLVGDGFLLDSDALEAMGGADGDVIRPFLSNRDLVQRSRALHVIDFGSAQREEALARHPAAYQRVLDEVKPLRDQNKDRQRRERWWLFGRSNERMRANLAGLRRYIATPEVAKHRPFVFVSEGTVPDASLYVIGSEDAGMLGVLSSSTHVRWAIVAGGRQGAGNDPRYHNGNCFEKFPFPAATEAQAARIRDLGERLDAHRKARQAAHPDLTLTGMYNVLEKLRAGEPLSDKERIIHDHGLVSILREIHDALDIAVLDAYGWPHDIDDEGLLERLVALNQERAAEEKRGLIRWLRPEYQRPLAGEPTAEVLPLPGMDIDKAPSVETAAAPWPKALSERIAAVRSVLEAGRDASGVEDVARGFKGARRGDVAEILDSLAALGIAVVMETPGGRRWQVVRRAAA